MCFVQYYSVSQLIDLRFILSKFCHLNVYNDDNVSHIVKLFKKYKDYLVNQDGVDIEFPEFKLNFGEDEHT